MHLLDWAVVAAYLAWMVWDGVRRTTVPMVAGFVLCGTLALLTGLTGAVAVRLRSSQNFLRASALTATKPSPARLLAMRTTSDVALANHHRRRLSDQRDSAGRHRYDRHPPRAR